MTQDVPSASADVAESAALASAGRAIALCCRGEIDKGLALYREALSARDDRDARFRLPVGLHLRVLNDAQRGDVAAVITREALAAGQNVNINAALGRPPADIAAEYRALFAEGAVNAIMIADYLLQLAKLDQTNELKSLVDVERVIRRTRLSMSDRQAAAEDYWNDLAVWLLGQRTAGNWHGEVQSVRDMHHIRLSGRADRRIQHLLSVLRDEAAQYLADLRAGLPLIRAWIPDEFRLNAWALISSGYGYNVPHIHPNGCATGVLYVSGPAETGPDGKPVGALRIGAPPTVENAVDWPAAAIAPEPGTLVLMPSYMTHWTTPLGKPGLRISIAFDVVALREP